MRGDGPVTLMIIIMLIAQDCAAGAHLNQAEERLTQKIEAAAARCSEARR